MKQYFSIIKNSMIICLKNEVLMSHLTMEINHVDMLVDQ